jgi:hypothetical protein
VASIIPTDLTMDIIVDSLAIEEFCRIRGRIHRCSSERFVICRVSEKTVDGLSESCATIDCRLEITINFVVVIYAIYPYRGLTWRGWTSASAFTRIVLEG